MARPWPNESVWLEGVERPETWGKPGVVMFLNIECAGCVARGIPFLKQLHREHGDAFVFVAIHTSHGHRSLPREAVVPELVRFSRDFARLPVPVMLDLDGEVAREWGAEGTPHWLVFSGDGTVARSVFGSQDNARTRIGYAVAELTQGDG